MPFCFIIEIVVAILAHSSRVVHFISMWTVCAVGTATIQMVAVVAHASGIIWLFSVWAPCYLLQFSLFSQFILRIGFLCMWSCRCLFSFWHLSSSFFIILATLLLHSHIFLVIIYLIYLHLIQIIAKLCTIFDFVFRDRYHFWAFFWLIFMRRFGIRWLIIFLKSEKWALISFQSLWLRYSKWW